KLDGSSVKFSDSTSSMNSWEEQTINFGALSAGTHTIEIYASPAPNHFMFDWFNLTAISTCTPNCAGKTCGDDGCGGSCGVCSVGYICQNSACVSNQTTATCTDSDGGINKSVKGIASNGEVSYEDRCMCYNSNQGYYQCDEGGYQLEMYCNSEGVPGPSSYYNCSYLGKVCRDGSCVAITNQTTATCTDSDVNSIYPDGKNYGVKGTTGYIKDGVSDYEEDTCNYYNLLDTLGERYCSDDGRRLIQPYLCPNGCENGACVSNQTTATCTDSDGGLNYYIKGEIRHFYNVHTNNPDFYGWHVSQDQCNLEGSLSEFSCEYYNATELFPYINYNCSSEGKVCQDGACVAEDIGSKSCAELKEFIKNPKDIEVDDREWILNWNGSWEYNQEKNYHASFSQSSDYQSSYVSLEMTELESIEDIETRLTQAIEEGICQKEKIYNYDTEDNEDYNVVYLCKNIWDVAYNTQRNLGGDTYSNQITAIWTSGNSVFKVYTSNYDYNNCYDYKDCKRLEEDRHRQQQERIANFLEKLISNEPEYVGGFYLPWETTQFVNLFLTSCGSDIGEEEYVGSWSCKLEPAICPPHGEQKEICTRWNENLRKEETREAEISCNPGICSGCYVPKWFGGSARDNKCIPYGFRFEHEFDSFEEEFYDENYEEISVAEFNKELYERENLMKAETTEEGKITLWVNRGRFADEEIEYSVTISPDTTEGDFDVYYLSSGDKADITIKEFAGAREEKLSILLGDISYNSANPDESIVGPAVLLDMTVDFQVVYSTE
ncbi:hypothetical protein KJ763_03025, partial [Patescibacteria group bacterium]|nr:hypothetical protein [Patescibacteria group bacterium]